MINVKFKKTCDKAVDCYLLALKFFHDWLVTNKVIAKLDSVLFLMVI